MVVFWEQYGSGKSCDWSSLLASSSEPLSADGNPEDNSMPRQRVNLRSAMQDAEELVRFLCHRFRKPSVALVAHDSGSVLAIHLAQAHPSLVHSLFLVAPLVNFERQNDAALRWALGKAKQEHRYSVLAQIDRGQVASPPANVTQLMTLRQAVTQLGGDLRKGNFILKFMSNLFSTSEYSVADKLAVLPCASQLAAHLFEELQGIKLNHLPREINVPVTAVCGQWDRLASCDLVEEYIQELRLISTEQLQGGETEPRKKLIMLPHSAHWPFIEEEGPFQELLSAHLHDGEDREGRMHERLRGK